MTAFGRPQRQSGPLLLNVRSRSSNAFQIQLETQHLALDAVIRNSVCSQWASAQSVNYTDDSQGRPAPRAGTPKHCYQARKPREFHKCTKIIDQDPSESTVYIRLTAEDMYDNKLEPELFHCSSPAKRLSRTRAVAERPKFRAYLV
jgi:hypothetical protein